ncbi:MAG: sugar kinase [Sedimentibacter saalensis]|jgi:2-dehydro-3-deoxygluconokinase|uniref:2-dehydro-3-deoxygluconokinase n=1 Tax=Sedimentibacter saalensis TaxID=130788 RepID=A0A562J3P3_9FIRM|nr:sugar kinase [Sedimentibacter saalensis]MEA5095062.1 sugar kinase [Sedimentibacter saalensis]TWH77780.1 2-dehydro-3-deoxygluconokinase [Sedimentibacter saalensis]
MKKVVTLGEIMLRLSTPGYERFIQADSFDVVYGGGEANVAVSLANFGYDAYFVSKLPKNEIGQAAINHLRRFGVSTDYIVRGGERVGIYYLESGASMRPSKVVYDRAHSSISEAEASDFDFDAIFKDADWFHFSGITPALSEKAAYLTEEALKAAKKHGVTVSVDLNYRKNLWSSERAKEVMTHLMQYVDVCIGNEEDAEKVLGFKPGETDVTSGELELAGYRNIFEQMKERFGFKYVISSLRESYSASDNGWSACAYDGNEFYHSRKYDIRIVDRVGGGDSFAAGVIYGLLEGKDFKDALDFGVAASALKHTINGDFNMVTVSEVENLLKGDASGRVQR